MAKPQVENSYFLSYGLNRDPFPLDSLDQNIYLTPEINRRLKQAKQHIANEQTSLLLSSPPGSGKSLIAQKLLILRDENWKTSFVSATPEMGSDVLAFDILEQLAPELCDSKNLAVNMLHKFLEQSFKETMLPVIVIDDAQLLPFETLQFILQLADLRYQECLFRFVLFADESISEI